MLRQQRYTDPCLVCVCQKTSRRVWTPKLRGNFDPTDKLLKDIEDYHRLQSPDLKNVGGISMDNRL